MEAAYEQLKKDGLNNVDNIVYWMKNSKVIEDTEEAETNLRKMFEGAQDQNNIEFQKFQEVIGKTAADANKSQDEMLQMMLDAMPNLQGALAAAANAFQAALSGK